MKRATLLMLALALCACEVETSEPNTGEDKLDASMETSPSTDPDAGADASVDPGVDPEDQVDAGVDAGDPPVPEDVTYVSDPTSGWVAAGSKPDSYTMGTDPEVQLDGKAVAGLRSSDEMLTIDDFGTWMTRMPLSKSQGFLGRRVRMSAQIKTANLEDWAGMWMRIDGTETHPATGYADVVGFDNMGERPILGTTEWTKYEIVLDVPPQVSGIFFGVLVSSKGSAWMGPVTFETVDDSVPTTGIPVDDF
jgi:hypothetical protein